MLIIFLLSNAVNVGRALFNVGGFFFSSVISADSINSLTFLTYRVFVE